MNVAFIGLGIMGGRMASNLQAAGHRLAVYDVRKHSADAHLAAGAVWRDTPRAVAKAVDVVFTSLPGPPERRALKRLRGAAAPRPRRARCLPGAARPRS